MPLLALAILSLAACATGPSEPLQAAVIVKCGTVVSYPADAMKKAAAELDSLPPDSALANVLLPDLKRMRDEARACASKTPPPA
jgi:hypothetical protein